MGKSSLSILAFFVLVSFLLITGCGQAGNNNPAGVTGGIGEIADNPGGGGNADDLIGTWFYEEIENDRDSYKYQIYLTFNNDGTFSEEWRDFYWDEDYDDWIMYDSYFDNGVFSVSGNQLTITYNDGYSFTATYLVNGDELTLSGYIEEDDEYFTMTFTRYYGKSNRNDKNNVPNKPVKNHSDVSNLKGFLRHFK